MLFYTFFNHLESLPVANQTNSPVFQRLTVEGIAYLCYTSKGYPTGACSILVWKELYWKVHWWAQLWPLFLDHCCQSNQQLSIAEMHRGGNCMKEMHYTVQWSIKLWLLVLDLCCCQSNH
jgi:hypothetical protein